MTLSVLAEAQFETCSTEFGLRVGTDEGGGARWEQTARKKQGLNAEPFLLRKAKQSFYNTSPLDMKKLMGDQDHIRENLFAYILAFSPAA